jgi:hypothetical protein
MTYGFNPALFVENGPAIQAAKAHARSSGDEYRAWRSLAPSRRLNLVERALGAVANDDCPDGFPCAL